MSLKQKLSNKELKFELKSVIEKTMDAAFRKIKKKKSSGSDGLCQEHLALGSNVLLAPLMKIFSTSLKSGIFQYHIHAFTIHINHAISKSPIIIIKRIILNILENKLLLLHVHTDVTYSIIIVNDDLLFEVAH